MPYAHITGWGMYVPKKVLTNDDLSKMVDTNDQWIRERTGIRERHIAAPGHTSSYLGVKAATEALKVANIAPSDLDFSGSGLKAASVIRLGFLATLPPQRFQGVMDSVSPERHLRLLQRLSDFLKPSEVA